MILGCMEVIAEGQTLSEKSGIGADALHGLLKGMLYCRFIIGCEPNVIVELLPAGP